MDTGGPYVQGEVVQLDIGAGEQSIVIPSFQEPPARGHRLLYGPELFSPSEIHDDTVYVTVPEVWIGPFGTVHSSRVIRVEGMQLGAHPSLRNGFFVLPQWATDPTAPIERPPLRRRARSQPARGRGGHQNAPGSGSDR